MKTHIKLKDYDLNFYFKPNPNNCDFDQIKKDLIYVKNNYNPNLDFGIFSEKIGLDASLPNTMLSIFYLNLEPVGFFYNYLFTEPISLNLISHQGLFVLNKNTGVDILNSVGVISSILLFNEIKDKFFITTMSSTPSVLESIVDNIHNAWPSYDKNCQRPPKEYKDIFKFALSKYQDVFLSPNEKISIDEKRFKIKFNESSLDYPKSIFEFPLAKKIDHNIFYNFWIDYSKSEMVFLVGEWNQEVTQKNIDMINKVFNIKL